MGTKEGEEGKEEEQEVSMGRPRLIVLAGPSGSGKTTRANDMLTARPSLLYAARDPLRAMLTNRIDEGCLTRVMAHLVVAVVHECRSDVLVDSPNLELSDRTLWTDVAEALGADMEWIDCGR